MRDVIVVGARCAGATTAMLLARKGHDVLLVDRATFPSDIPHGHLVHRHGPARLARWGLLDRVLATNCPPITSITLDYGDFPLTARDLTLDGLPVGVGPRRSALDDVLVNAAVEAGAELREGFPVDEFVAEDGRITGVRGRVKETGAAISERATITIGADGRHSHLARTVDAAVYADTPPLTFWYFAYWAEAVSAGMELFVRGEAVVLAFPTNDGLLGVFVGWAAPQLSAVRANVEARFMAVIDSVEGLSERLRGGRRVERFLGATDLPNFFRTPGGPGWALVGDAGCHKDPFMALGICDAFRDAELLAAAVDDALGGRLPMDDALAAYHRQRDAAAMPDYETNVRAASFEPLQRDHQRLREALRGNEDDTAKFLMATIGMIPAESFFQLSNIRRIIGRARGSVDRTRR
jgi:flavin-dependent dehydrogenase